jgi:hypothetical protein
MSISDTTSAAIKVGKEAIGDESNLCLMHLINLALGHLTGTKFTGQHVYFELGRNIVSQANSFSVYFLKLKDKDALHDLMIAHNIDPRNKPKLATETRPTSNLALIRQLIKLQPVIEAYVTSRLRKKEFEDLVKLYDAINWNHLAELEALISPVTSWSIFCQNKGRPLLSWNAVIPEILKLDLADGSYVEKVDLESYSASLKDISQIKTDLPRVRVKISDLSDVGMMLVLKLRELLEKYLSLSHQKKSNLLPALYCDPMARILMDVLNKTTANEAKMLARTVAIELANSNINSGETVASVGSPPVFLIQIPFI